MSLILLLDESFSCCSPICVESVVWGVIVVASNVVVVDIIIFLVVAKNELEQ